MSMDIAQRLRSALSIPDSINISPTPYKFFEDVEDAAPDKLYMLLMCVVTINREMQLDLGVDDIFHLYDLRKIEHAYYLRARTNATPLVEKLPSSDSGWRDETLVQLTGLWVLLAPVVDGKATAPYLFRPDRLDESEKKVPDLSLVKLDQIARAQFLSDRDF
ncbi:hypothetical protein QJS10_CPA09g00896 [Acorus calamus]|uniref:Uncharacterized protein n=1 Tax=Acorus calamus TaxID=4465 RepID=A0AAV9E7A2_ACOCL|nr:hypothetical protein QJS10_CPA09g00896 [Acorus calamus]